MLSIYLSALVFGGILILFSIVLGGDSDKSIEADKDFDFGDADVDADADADGSMHGDVDSTWLPFLSMRFWTFGLASFGMTGSILQSIDEESVLTLPVSIVLGITIGWITAYIFNRLKKERVSGETNSKTLVSEEALVILPIKADAMGKIRVNRGGENVDIFARSTEYIDRGESVLVVHVQNGIAEVCTLNSKKKITQQQSKKQGV